MRTDASVFFRKRGRGMFYSVLFPNNEEYQVSHDQESIAKPYFKDLGLDLVFKPIFDSNKQANLESFYYKPLCNIETISYRQAVAKELENAELKNIMESFSDEIHSIHLKMKKVRKDISSKKSGSNNYLIYGQMLNYAGRYCQVIDKLKKSFSFLDFSSEGIMGLNKYIDYYVETESYKSMIVAIDALREEFSNLEYVMLIDGGTIKIRKYDNEADYSKNIESTFKKFGKKSSKDFRQNLSEKPKAKHVEVGVLNILSKIYKEPFNNLSGFFSEFINFDDEIICNFAQELQFYLSWIGYIKPLKESSLKFNYPSITKNSKKLFTFESFDLALAKKIKDKIVCNNFKLQNEESILVITGPNQGGKTTYAKMIGQIHYLASLGLCVPGTSSSLYLFDNIFTHFSKEEDLATQDGKLKDDLERLHKIITSSTDKSLIIINEIFSSTTLEDAVYLGTEMIDLLTNLESPTVIVSFLDELASHNENVVSMMSTVNKNNPIKRTYKVVRKAPDGAAYAIHLAKKHNLTYEKLLRRLDQ